MSPVNTKFFFIYCPHFAGVSQFAHADNTRIGQSHRSIGIFIQELEDRSNVFAQCETEQQITSCHQFHAKAWVADQMGKFIKHTLAGFKRCVISKLLMSPVMMLIRLIQERFEQAGISDFSHAAP